MSLPEMVFTWHVNTLYAQAVKDAIASWIKQGTETSFLRIAAKQFCDEYENP